MRLEHDVIRALHAKMVEGLNDRITEVNSTLADDDYYQLDAVDEATQILDYMPPVSQLVAMPTFAIAEDTITFDDDTGWSATGRFPLSIVIVVQEYDPRALAWKLRHYMVALANCVLAGRTLGEAGWGMTLRGVTPGPKLRVRESPSDETSGRSAVLGLRALTIEIRDEQDQ